jgi:hypothetical protein
MMKFERAARNRCKIKMSIQGPSGSGKTYSALLVAKGLVKDLSKVAVIDSENGSSHLYSELGVYSVLGLKPPFTPEKYTEAVKVAIQEGFECVIIDSLSHEWSGSGGILDAHSQMTGNSFTNWGKLTPRHNAMMQSIINADVHVISTLRSKTDFIIENKNGKNVPQKVGLKGVQRDDTEYEFTLSFELNQSHQARVSKDRTGLFKNSPELILSKNTGSTILHWCNQGEEDVNPMIQGRSEFEILNERKTFKQRILDCNNMDALNELYRENPGMRLIHKNDFTERKDELLNLTKIQQNGTID